MRPYYRIRSSESVRACLRRGASREGYTLFELLIILVVIVILGAVIVPTLDGVYSNTRQKSAADLIRSRISDARTKAIEQGVWYRLAVNQDKTRIRLAADTQNFSSVTPDNPASPTSNNVEDKFDKVTVEVTYDPNDPRASNNTDDWLTVTTIGPEGICREQYNTTITVKESKFQPVLIEIRGLVGSSAIVPPSKKGSK